MVANALTQIGKGSQTENHSMVYVVLYRVLDKRFTYLREQSNLVHWDLHQYDVLD